MTPRAAQFSTVGVLAALALVGVTQAAEEAPGFVRDGRAGFVVSHISYALGRDSQETGACPSGMGLGYRGVFEASADGARREGETDVAYACRAGIGGQSAATARSGENLCMHPELGEPDQHFRTMTAENIPADGGIYLDGRDSRANGRAAPGACAHTDFRGVNGECGIDNQFYRVVGCLSSYQSVGQSNGFGNGMRTGSWGLLITLGDVDDERVAQSARRRIIDAA